jgi:hypothetical protein
MATYVNIRILNNLLNNVPYQNISTSTKIFRDINLNIRISINFNIVSGAPRAGPFERSSGKKHVRKKKGRESTRLHIIIIGASDELKREASRENKNRTASQIYQISGRTNASWCQPAYLIQFLL